MIKWLAVVVGISLVFPNNLIAVEKEFSFEKTSAISSPVIARSQAYDSSPVAIEENGITKVWYCGGGLRSEKYYGHDSIFYASFDRNGKIVDSPRRVIGPSLNDFYVDGDHACAVTVIKHNGSSIVSGSEKYQMYYECAPRVFRQDNGVSGSSFTEICHATSDDGINWKKFNNKIWSSNHVYVDVNSEPTSVISLGMSWPNTNLIAGANIATNIKLQVETSGKRTASFLGDKNAGDLGANYGVGHPTAVTMPLGNNGQKQIWLWYYDSQGDFNQRALYLVKSLDGIHFDKPIKTNLQSPNKIKYVDVAVGDHQGFFISSTAPFFINVFNYSWDGINWYWADQGLVSFYTDYLKNNFNLGSATECVTGNGAIIGDQYGYLKSFNIKFLSVEGFFGKNDNCTATNGCKCYSSIEDNSRGDTWDMYLLSGKIKPTNPLLLPPVGDANSDGVINIIDFGIWKSEYIFRQNNRSDFNKDGRIDIVDFTLWKKAYLNS